MTGFSLKIIALILMLIDHIGEFFPEIAPIWFRWLGRLSAPLFMFCVVQGLQYTRDIKKYIGRLYVFSIVMAAGNLMLMSIFPDAPVGISNNIFGLFTVMGIIVWISRINKEDKKKGSKYIVIFILLQIVMMVALNLVPGSLVQITAAVIPNIFACEGGITWLLLGLLLYKYRQNTTKLSIAYIIFSGFMLALTGVIGFTVENVFYLNYQWMMIGSLPFMVLYNGERGRGLKYLFYLFYPLHIWILFILSNIL